MSQSTGATRTPIGRVLMIAGGLLTAIGSFLAWAKLEAGTDSATASGIDGSDGYITLVAGIVIAVCGLASFARARRALAVLAIVGGVVAAGIGAYDAVSAEESAIDALATELSGSFGVSGSEAKALLEEAVDQGLVSVSLQFGIFLVIAGGALGIVGGALGAAAAGRSEPVPTMAEVPAVASAPQGSGLPAAPDSPPVPPPGDPVS